MITLDSARNISVHLLTIRLRAGLSFFLIENEGVEKLWRIASQNLQHYVLLSQSQEKLPL